MSHKMHNGKTMRKLQCSAREFGPEYLLDIKRTKPNNLTEFDIKFCKIMTRHSYTFDSKLLNGTCVIGEPDFLNMKEYFKNKLDDDAKSNLNKFKLDVIGNFVNYDYMTNLIKYTTVDDTMFVEYALRISEYKCIDFNKSLIIDKNYKKKKMIKRVGTSKYSNIIHKNKINKTYRNLVKSQFRQKKYNSHDIENYVLPIKSKSPENWWDCESQKGKVF